MRKEFLFPTAALSKVFRGKYLDFLDAAHRKDELRLQVVGGGDDSRKFDWLKTALRAHDWVVYAKAPFAGAEHVLAYLGRYTHKRRLRSWPLQRGGRNIQQAAVTEPIWAASTLPI